MQFFWFLAFVCLFNFSAEADETEEVPSVINEIQRRESACKCSDITPLLNKLISELEDMKGKILHEMPEQLAMQAEEMKRLRADLKEMKGIDMEIKEQLKKQDTDIQEIMKSANRSNSGSSSACDDQPYLRRIESSVENVAIRTKQISEHLQTHDQRLQTLTDICRNSIGVCDCSTIRANGVISSGMYRIYVDHLDKRYYANVYCDMTTGNGGWTVFQRRKDGSVDFFRGWSDYENGFGSPNGEFWLGNSFIHLLTSKRRYRLRIDLEDFEGGKRYAEYSTFNINSSEDKYRLKIGTYSGNAGDSLIGQNGQRFSTKDSDNDAWSTVNCAVNRRGAWWYSNCAYSNLNGLYLRGRYSPNGSFDGHEGIQWYHWRFQWYSLKTTEMKIIFS